MAFNLAESCFLNIMELGDDLTTGQNINPRFYVPKTVAKQVALRGRLPLSECVQLGLSLSAALDSLHWDMHADLVVLANGKSVKRLKLLEKRIANLKKIGGISAIVLVALAAILFQIYREWNFAREGRQRQIGAEVAYGTRAMEEGDLLNSLPSFAAALQLDRGSADREKIHRLRLRAVLGQTPKLVQMWFSDHQLAEASFDPDGKRVLIIESLGKAQVFDLMTGEPASAAFVIAPHRFGTRRQANLSDRLCDMAAGSTGPLLVQTTER